MLTNPIVCATFILALGMFGFDRVGVRKLRAEAPMASLKWAKM